MAEPSAKKSLLLVDDSRDYAFIVARAFSKAAPGTAVFPLSDGQRAIEHLALCGVRYPLPDLVLLDRVLPGGPDGLAVLRAIRSLERLRQLPVLMISGSDDEEHVAQARDAGADGYIVKPAIKDEYSGLVQKICAWRPAESWREVGPKLAGTCLAVQAQGVGSSPAMALHSEVATLFSPLTEDQSFGQRVLGFLEWWKSAALGGLDPFQLALSQACRRHHLSPSQAMRGGGSHRMVANRRAVLVELLAEGWPDETLMESFVVSKTELKRLHAAARAKVGPKLDLRLN